MKKALLTAGLLTGLVTGSTMAQKITPAKKELLFKNTAYWEKQHTERLKTAPANISAQINEFNTKKAAEKGYTFKMAYTTVWGRPMNKITGALPPDAKRPGTIFADGGAPPPPPGSAVTITATVNDGYVDMRDYGIITGVGVQGSECGCCWAFASVSAFETSWLMRNGGDAGAFNMSEQQVMNCTAGAHNCDAGGNVYDAFDFMIHHDVLPQPNPTDYSEAFHDCAMGNAVHSGYRAYRYFWKWFPYYFPNNQEIKQAIIDHGSVVATIYSTDLFGRFGGGLYNADDASFGQILDHVVQVIGWDDNRQAWLVKNSWGEGWGDGGFGWVKYNTNHIGYGYGWIDCIPPPVRGTVINNPYAAGTNVDYSIADFNTLYSLYDNVSVYTITGRSSHKVLDCDDPLISNENKGRRIIQYRPHGQECPTCSDGHNQQWFFIYAGQRNNKPVYRLFNYGFNNFLVHNNSGKPECSESNGNDDFFWYILPQGNAHVVKIKNVVTNQFLQSPDMNDGSEMVLADEATTDKQVFDLNTQPYNPAIPLGAYYLLPKHHPAGAVDVTGGNAADGTGLQLWDKINWNPNQFWKLSFNVYTRYYQFHSALPGDKMLEVYTPSSFPSGSGARAQIWSANQASQQEWLIIRMAREPDKFILINHSSGKCLDVSNVGTTNGTPVQQWEFVNGDNQKWILQKAE